MRLRLENWSNYLTTRKITLKTSRGTRVLGFSVSIIAVTTTFLMGYFIDYSWFSITAISTLMLAFVWRVVTEYSITLDTDSLVFKKAFHSESIRIEKIESLALQSGIIKYSDRFKPLFRLVAVENTSHLEIMVNAKIFDLSEIQYLLRVVNSDILLRK